MIAYTDFIERKTQVGSLSGFAPLWIPGAAFDFQQSLLDWAINKGRAAIFADCGLGKTLMQLVWAENVVRHTNKPVLILTPLAVASQTIREADKFGIAAVRSQDGKLPEGACVVVTNYERLHHFSPGDFSGVVCDESSILKDFDGKTRTQIIDFMRRVMYRLLCTATAAPNDYDELGNSSEALGELGYQDMLTRFFKKQTNKDHLGWGRTKHKLRGHAEKDFWRWVCSWARAVRKPSDLGFDDGRFQLPPLLTEEHVIKATVRRADMLFDLPAITLEEQREERRRTLPDRCEKVAALVADTGKPAVCWVHLNDEGDLVERLVSGAVQVSGSDPNERKEEVFEAFATGQIRVIVTKPTIAGFGLNWQHCAHQTFFPSHSFEQWYQAIRRCLRFGQTQAVRCDIVTSEGEAGVLGNLQRKQEAAEIMFANLVSLMNEQLRINRLTEFTRKQELPAWL